MGGQDHMRLLLLAEQGGIDLRSVRYVPFDGGGEALTSLLGGFVHVIPADASEMLPQYRAGGVRILAVLARERLGAPFEDVPTAREQGFDVEWLTWRGFYVPKGIGDEAFSRWVRLFEALTRSAEWEVAARRRGLFPMALTGAPFERLVLDQIRDFRRLTARLGLIS